MGVYIVKQKRNAALVYLVEAEDKQGALEKLAEYSRMPGITPDKLAASDEITAEIDDLKESENDVEDVLL